jgi:GNAT superfamily N-acetyltransferase
MTLAIRELQAEDPSIISNAFALIDWTKPSTQYDEYFSQQTRDERVVRVATVSNEFAGYVTVVFASSYPAFRETGIPEIQDLNVLPSYRGRGIASRLLDEAEQLISKRSPIAGIGVGLHPGYNAAQRLYVKRGYVPDGKGVTYCGRYVQEGESVQFDDELVLWMSKQIA